MKWNIATSCRRVNNYKKITELIIKYNSFDIVSCYTSKILWRVWDWFETFFVSEDKLILTKSS